MKSSVTLAYYYYTLNKLTSLSSCRMTYCHKNTTNKTRSTLDNISVTNNNK